MIQTSERSGTVVSEPVPCSGLQHIFFGDESDGRSEDEREAREERAKSICNGGCEHRMRCLERALVMGESRGVWGGMGEGERRRFRRHLRAEGYEGYKNIPEGLELYAALQAFIDMESERAAGNNTNEPLLVCRTCKEPKPTFSDFYWTDRNAPRPDCKKCDNRRRNRQRMSA